MNAPRESPQIVSVDCDHPDPAAIARAADLIRNGRLVAFPTETVYGLGANALDGAAVARIFAAKGRPANNPIIVHVASPAAARGVVRDWPERAARLAARFWPGPLTLILPRGERVPDEVTAGGLTVGVRMPAHRVALALLAAADVPIAAPSANRSNHISPTRAAHVVRSLDSRVNLILDAGPTTGGIESTVLDLSQTTPRVLRAGLITIENLTAVCGDVKEASTVRATTNTATLAAPGQLPRHYAPAIPVLLALSNSAALTCIDRASATYAALAWLSFGPAAASSVPTRFVQAMPTDPHTYARELYAALHAVEQAGVDAVIVTLPPEESVWRAIRDRLARAAGNEG